MADVVAAKETVDDFKRSINEIVSDFPEINIFGSNDEIKQSNIPDNTNSESNPVVINDTKPSSTIPNQKDNQIIPENKTPNSEPGSTNSNNSTASTTNSSNDPINNATTVPEKVKFESVTLTACDTKTKKRIAKEGEILYYVNSSSNKIDKTDIALTINPNLAKDKIKDNLHWFSNNTTIDNSDGLLKFTTKDLDKDATIKSVAGFPTESAKSVDVKFVDDGYFKNTFSLGSGNFKNPLIKKAFEATKMLESTTKALEKIPFIKKVQNKGLLKSGGINYYYTIIPFEEEYKKIEDPISRLYYGETKTRGGFELGIEGKVKVWTWGLPFEKLPLPQWTIDKIKEVITAEVNIVASASSSGEMKALVEERLYAESITTKKIKSGVNPAIVKLDIAFGIESEFSVGGQNDYLSGGINASGMTKAELFRIGYYDNQFSVIQLYYGVYIELKASGYINTLGKKWETERYNKKIIVIKENHE